MKYKNKFYRNKFEKYFFFNLIKSFFIYKIKKFLDLVSRIYRFLRMIGLYINFTHSSYKIVLIKYNLTPQNA